MTLKGYTASHYPCIMLMSVYLLLAFYACAVWAQGGTIRNCWFESPVITESSINVEMVPRNTTRADGSRSWDLITRVTWQRPTGMLADNMYTLRLKSFDGMMDGESVLTDPCLVNIDEILVNTEEYIFNDLTFGQLYELEIHLYRPAQQQKSIMGAMSAFETPDCFQVTGDQAFCLDGVAVQYSGAPMEPEVNSLCRNSSTRLLRVSLTWLPPLHVNGSIFLYTIDYGVVGTPAPDVVPGAPTGNLNSLTVFPANTNGSNQTVSALKTEIQGLDEGKLYYIRITPIVDSAIDGGKYPGNDVELTFITANWTDPLGETTEINLATPLCEVFDEATISPNSNATKADTPSTTDNMSSTIPSSTATANDTIYGTATTPARLPPPSRMEPAHIALIVIFTLLIVTVIIVFIIITIRMARNGSTIAKLPPLSKLPTMCKKQQQEGDEKKKDLNMVEKGAKPSSEKKPSQTTSSKPKETVKS